MSIAGWGPCARRFAGTLSASALVRTILGPAQSGALSPSGLVRRARAAAICSRPGRATPGIAVRTSHRGAALVGSIFRPPEGTGSLRAVAGVARSAVLTQTARADRRRAGSDGPISIGSVTGRWAITWPVPPGRALLVTSAAKTTCRRAVIEVVPTLATAAGTAVVTTAIATCSRPVLTTPIATCSAVLTTVAAAKTALGSSVVSASKPAAGPPVIAATAVGRPVWLTVDARIRTPALKTG